MTWKNFKPNLYTLFKRDQDVLLFRVNVYGKMVC